MDGFTTKITKEIIESYIEQGLLKRQWHPTLPLQILNYTQKTDFEKLWDDVTLQCRGLILDDKYNLVVPCMHKFFNFFQLGTEKQKEVIKNWKDNEWLITRKFDGTLGIIFAYEGQIVCASRGSFDSFVTKEMYKMIKNTVFVNDLEDTSTAIVCEVICPETHILVNYGQRRELRVITMFRADYENQQFSEYDFDTTTNLIQKFTDNKESILKPVDVVKMSLDEMLRWQREHDWSEEGWVARNIKTNERIKFKSDDYLRVAAMKANFDPIHIYKRALEVAKVSKSINNWYENMKLGDTKMPDELYSEYTRILDKIKDILETKYREVCKIHCVYKDVSNKEIGLNQNFTSNTKSLLFSLRKQEPIIEKLLKISGEECLNV